MRAHRGGIDGWLDAWGGPLVAVLLMAIALMVMLDVGRGVRAVLAEPSATPTPAALGAGAPPLLAPAQLRDLLPAAVTQPGHEEEPEALTTATPAASEADRSSAVADAGAPASTPHLLAVQEPPAGVTAASSAPVPGPVGSGFESRAGTSHSPLTEQQLRGVLLEAGWPVEYVPHGLAIACGIATPGVYATAVASHPSGESGCDPAAVGAAGEAGLLQVHPIWFATCGATGAQLADPLTNARCALQIVRDGEASTGNPWQHWRWYRSLGDAVEAAAVDGGGAR